MAATLDSELILVHVYEVPVFEWRDGSFLPTPRSLDTRARQVDELLLEQTSAARDAGAEKVRAVKIVGAPAQEILQFAETSGADVIVMTTRGRTRVRDALVGSVAERVVQNARCPVLVVPSRSRDGSGASG